MFIELLCGTMVECSCQLRKVRLTSDLDEPFLRLLLLGECLGQRNTLCKAHFGARLEGRRLHEYQRGEFCIELIPSSRLSELRSS